MPLLLETLMTKTDVSIAYVNLTVAMNSGDVSTVALSAISTSYLWLFLGGGLHVMKTCGWNSIRCAHEFIRFTSPFKSAELAIVINPLFI
jgi:hypothetical protein